MPLAALILVLCSACFHASWNLICKKNGSGSSFFFALTVTSSLFWLPQAVWIFAKNDFTVPDGVWVALVFSGLSNALYFFGLGKAYKLADLSLTYPLVKALPVLFVTLAGIIYGTGSSLGALAALGIFVLMFGSLMLPLKRFREFSLRNYWRAALFFIMLTALASSSYMILDKYGVSKLKDSCGHALAPQEATVIYIFFENIFILPFLLLTIIFERKERKIFSESLKNFSYHAPVAGILSTLSYALVLWAMSLSSDLGLLVALRQLSIPLGAFAGIIFLKEPSHAPKLTGAGMILVGLTLMYLKF